MIWNCKLLLLLFLNKFKLNYIQLSYFDISNKSVKCSNFPIFKLSNYYVCLYICVCVCYLYVIIKYISLSMVKCSLTTKRAMKRKMFFFLIKKIIVYIMDNTQSHIRHLPYLLSVCFCHWNCLTYQQWTYWSSYLRSGLQGAN